MRFLAEQFGKFTLSPISDASKWNYKAGSVDLFGETLVRMDEVKRFSINVLCYDKNLGSLGDDPTEIPTRPYLVVGAGIIGGRFELIQAATIATPATVEQN